ncbi:L-type lectin-domain containing receptor kinase SIT2-like [Typha angustifolia]|uniref:L-type lectin-domain containing receptor kinase SIT2-like n=1 Tax=Typha angustifolia TaxID=59011 RepID=UPI003C2E93C4
MLPKILILILLVQFAAASHKFLFNGFSSSNLRLSGSAEIEAGGLLRLTNETQEILGHGFYPVPIQFKKASDGMPQSFSTIFVFAIRPQYPDSSGHGIAFAISPSTDLPGSMPSQHLGLFNTSDNGNSTNHVVAIELDTVKTVEFHDINNNHAGIDVNNLSSTNSSPAAYFDAKTGNFTSLKLISGDPMQVWIDYSGVDMQLDVTISPIHEPKPSRPLVSSKVNLSSVVLDDMYVGFSASTGAATGKHYILAWSFSLNGVAQEIDLSKLPSLPKLQGEKKESKSLAVVVALPLVAVILLLLSVAAAMSVVAKRKKYAELLEDWELEFGPHRLTYKDLFKATKGFNDEHLIGVGGFGKVYRGALPSLQTEIAVKKISHDSKQGMKEFISEIASMSRLRHRNLVQLLGYCRRQGELLLVYDYMPNGSLDKFLFDNGKQYSCLNWTQRFKIIKGVASGLQYLHDEWEQVVVHRDIKASNVLLDGDLNGKLGDFGLARLYDRGTNPQTTHIVGTLGYLAPEMSKTGKATTRTDVFAFGAFLLEVACGRRPMDFQESVEVPNLVDFVLESWKLERILEASDQKLGGDYNEDEMELVLKLGLSCSHPDPVARPSMRQVVQILEGNLVMPNLSPDRLMNSGKVSKYDESFDDFIISSFPSTSEFTYATNSSSMFTPRN